MLSTLIPSGVFIELPINFEAQIRPRSGLALKHNITLTRNSEDIVSLDGVEDEIFDNLQDEASLLVCEIEPTENEDESEIVYTYEASIVD